MKKIFVNTKYNATTTKHISRMCNPKKTKDFPTPHFSFSGFLLGYLESDEHYRKRIIKELNRAD